MIGEGLVFEDIGIFTKNPKKYEPVFTDFGWTQLNTQGGGMPVLYINVWNCSASLMYNGKEISKLFPKFSEWIEKSNICITQSGVYPPLKIIADNVQKQIEKGDLPEPNSFRTKEEYEKWKSEPIKQI